MSDTQLNINSLRTADLDNLITIQVANPSDDATSGQVVDTFVTLRTAWARIEYLSGVEAVSQGAINNYQFVNIIIRYMSDVNTACRISHPRSYYDIISIEMIGRQRFMKLNCKTVKQAQ